MRNFKRLGLAVAMVAPLAHAAEDGPAKKDKIAAKEHASKKHEIVEEIYIYGEYQQKLLQDSTSSISVISSRELKRNDATRIYDAIRALPNLTPAPPDFLPSIRGVQSAGALGLGGSILAASQTRAQLIVDDVARPQTYSNNAYQSMFDVQQVEILRGPQTTLRGSNSDAGAYVVKTRDPQFATEGALETSYSSNDYVDDGFRVSGMANQVLIDDELAARVVVQYEQDQIPTRVYDDGGVPAGSNVDLDSLSDTDSMAVRAKFLYQPAANPDVSALITLEYQEGLDQGFDSWIWGTDSAQWAPDGVAVDPEDRLYGFTGGVRIFDTKDHGVTADIRYQLDDNSEIRSITSYLDNQFKNAEGYDPAVLQISGVAFDDMTRDIFSQEFIYTQSTDRHNLLAGLSYSKQTGESTTSGFPIATNDNRKSLSVFADYTLHLHDQVDLLLGGRVMKSEVIMDGTVFIPVAVDQSETVFLPKAGAIYHIDDRHKVSVTARKGFNPGGGGVDFNAFAFYQYGPEYVWTYELGYRGELQDGAINLAATVFLNQYDDYQFFYSPDPFTSRILNFDGDTHGLELEVKWLATEELDIKLGIGLLKTEIDAPGEMIDGNRFGEDPKRTLSIAANYQFTDQLSADVSISNVSEYYADFLETVGTESGDYTNLDVGFMYQADSYKVRAFVRNASDKLMYFQKTQAGGSGYVLPPREVGLTMSYNF